MRTMTTSVPNTCQPVRRISVDERQGVRGVAQVVDGDVDAVDDARGEQRPDEPLDQPLGDERDRMNQFVAPTSFMTETSRRLAKMAMRIVLRISTPAETMQHERDDEEARSAAMSTVVWIAWIVASGRGRPANTPGYWRERRHHEGGVGRAGRACSGIRGRCRRELEDEALLGRAGCACASL